MSLKNELIRAVQFAPGTPKRATKMAEGRDMSYRVYSYAERDALRDMAHNFASWARDNAPDVKHASQLTEQYKIAFLDACRARGCSTATLRSYEDRLDKLALCINHTYRSAHVDLGQHGAYSRAHQAAYDRQEQELRNIAMTRDDDYRRLLASCRPCHGRDGIELTAAFATRSAEVTSVRACDVQDDGLHVHGKGGKWRTLPIETEEQAALLDRLKGQCHTSEDRLVPITTKGYQNYVRDHMLASDNAKYTQAKTGNHSLRKMVARERYSAARARGVSKEQAAGDVMEYLGHGRKRPDLIEIYLGDAYK